MKSGFIPEPENDKHYKLEESLFYRSLQKNDIKDTVNLRPYSLGVRDQGSTSSCVAHAVAKAVEVRKMMLHRSSPVLSRLALYFLARTLMVPRRTHLDKGTHVSTACDAMRRFGVCEESLWGFDKKLLNRSPTWSAMQSAYVNKIQAFYKITSKGDNRLEAIKRALSQGFPVVFGTGIGSNWYSYKKGQVLIPTTSISAYHAVVLLGYDRNVFYGENSWGTDWGNRGFFEIHPDHLTWQESSDFWVIQND